MGAHVIAGPVTIEEYLSNRAYEHCEYVNGELVPLNVGTRQHAKIQANCAYELKTYLKAHPGGYVGTELHCRLTINGETRFRLPDVAFLVKDTDPMRVSSKALRTWPWRSDCPKIPSRRCSEK